MHSASRLASRVRTSSVSSPPSSAPTLSFPSDPIPPQFKQDSREQRWGFIEDSQGIVLGNRGPQLVRGRNTTSIAKLELIRYRESIRAERVKGKESSRWTVRVIGLTPGSDR